MRKSHCMPGREHLTDRTHSRRHIDMAIEPILWNPSNKVVQDHRTGCIHHGLTNVQRALRGLPVPWTPAMAKREVRERPAY